VLGPLPSYAPKLNLQEQIWRWLRADVTHDHFFGSLDAARPQPGALSQKCPSNRQPSSVASAARSLHWSKAVQPLHELHQHLFVLDCAPAGA
jgi:hypothetical protein